MANENHFHFLVPVWGQAYTRRFTDVCLPMILTPGNLGGLARSEDDLFVILTTRADGQFICESPAFGRLQALIPTKFIYVDDGEVDMSRPHAAMSACYDIAMQSTDVRPGSTYFVFLTPDSFWSDGTFTKLVQLREDGKKVVMTMALRVDDEAAASMVRASIARNPDNPSIGRSQLVRFAIRNLHPMSRAHNWLSDQFLNGWPSHIYWIAGAGQLVAHCFHLHPIMVQAPVRAVSVETTIDGEFLEQLQYPLDSYHVVQDEFIGIELSDASKSWNQPLNHPSLRRVQMFSLMDTNALHWHFFGQRIVYQEGGVGPLAPEVADQVGHVVSQVMRFRRLSLLLRQLKLRPLFHQGLKIRGAVRRHAHRVVRIRGTRARRAIKAAFLKASVEFRVGDLSSVRA